MHLDRVVKMFDGRRVLDDVSLTLYPGKTTLLMGESGSGKTTLMQLLLGLITADAGERSGFENLRFSAVFQEDRLCDNLSAQRNIRLVNKNLPEDALKEAMHHVNLEWDNHAPVRTFSGGMKRRVAILRALLAPYDVLCMDEPLRGLDDATRQLVIEEINRLSRGRTRFIISHDVRDIEAFQVDEILQWHHLQAAAGQPLSTT